MVHLDWIRRHAERTPGKLALVDAHTGLQLTYKELDQRINRFSNFLQDELGIQHGDRISILAMNSASYYEILFACGRIGAILNTLNWRLAPPELTYILQDCAPKVLIYEPVFADAVSEFRPTLGNAKLIVLGGADSDAEWSYVRRP